MTAPAPRDTGPALDPRAVEAGVEAAMDHRVGTAGRCSCGAFAGTTAESIARHTMESILTAAAPFLRAEGAAAERQRIAAAIRANHQRAYHLDSTAGPLCICGRLDPCPDTALAARIALMEEAP